MKITKLTLDSPFNDSLKTRRSFDFKIKIKLTITIKLKYMEQKVMHFLLNRIGLEISLRTKRSEKIAGVTGQNFQKSNFVKGKFLKIRSSINYLENDFWTPSRLGPSPLTTPINFIQESHV